jgi:hypothetical protein
MLQPVEMRVSLNAIQRGGEPDSYWPTKQPGDPGCQEQCRDLDDICPSQYIAEQPLGELFEIPQ